MHSSNRELRGLRIILEKSVRVPGYMEVIILVKAERQRGDTHWGTVGPPSLVCGMEVLSSDELWLI